MTERILPENTSYPANMRRQLWPLCCGASILSGFKDVMKLTEDKLVKQIMDTINNEVPDLQVFAGEAMKPKLTFLTLNSGQMASKKIMDAIKAAGFVKIGAGSPRGAQQGFFVQDTSGTFTTEAVKNGVAVKEAVAA